MELILGKGCACVACTVGDRISCFELKQFEVRLFQFRSTETNVLLVRLSGIRFFEVYLREIKIKNKLIIYKMKQYTNLTCFLIMEQMANNMDFDQEYEEYMRNRMETEYIPELDRNTGKIKTYLLTIKF